MSTMRIESEGGELAYDVVGEGPLVVCAPSMGDLRGEYRYLAPRLAAAGFRAASIDVRGHGDSSTSFSDYAASAIGRDLLAVVRALGGPALLVGTSMSAAAAVWAAAQAPELVRGIVLIGPVVRDLPMTGFQRALIKVAFLRPWGAKAWTAYYRTLYPSHPPDDLADHVTSLQKNLRQKGRLEALRAMMWASKADCEARLAEVRAPALVVMGTLDPDFLDPSAEAKRVADAVRGDLFLVDGAGHYPHVEVAEATAAR